MVPQVCLAKRRTCLLGLVALAVTFAMLLQLVFISNTSYAQTATIVWLDADVPFLKVYDTLTVTVQISNVVDLYAGEFNLDFPHDAIAVVDTNPTRSGVQIAPADCPVPDFVAINSVDNATGDLSYVVTQLNPTSPVTGSCSTAYIPIRGLQEGTVHLSFSKLLLGTREGNPIPADPNGITLTVDGTPPVSVITAPLQTTTSPITISWVATETLSGVYSVTLWYRFNEGDWINAGLTDLVGEGFVFEFPEGKGTYDFAAQAADRAGNVEVRPTQPEASTTYRSLSRLYLPVVLQRYSAIHQIPLCIYLPVVLRNSG